MSRSKGDQVVRDFGQEWSDFDQSEAPAETLLVSFQRYFDIFPWDRLPKNARGFDLGCGSGRWARFVAPRVHRLVCLDASWEALQVARQNLSGAKACRFLLADAQELPLTPSSMDFGYSLGVLHHTVNVEKGLRAAVDLLKPGAPLLLYLYYRFEGRPLWFKALWRISDGIRRMVSRLPHAAKLPVSQALAATVYLPLARTARLAERLGWDVSNFPLSFYRDRSFYSMRTDALDRFGTRREKRFTRAEIRAMMNRAGLVDVAFSDKEPYWCAVGYRAHNELEAAPNLTA